MSEEAKEFSGRSVDEAVAAGLHALGLRSNQVQVEVVNKGSRGLFGIGSEPAVVRLKLIAPSIPVPPATQTVTDVLDVSKVSEVSTPIDLAPQPDSDQGNADLNKERQAEPVAEKQFATDQLNADSGVPASAADDDSETMVDATEMEAETEAASVEMLTKMVGLMGFRVTVEPVWKDSDDEHDKRVLWLEIHGNNLSSLIGRRGETLENIQYLLRMMVNQRLHRWNDIVVDVDQYRIRRAEQISQLANRLADQALSAGRAMALEPMPPNERRVVHMALRNHPHVYTQSSGDGERRKVYIVPKS